MQRKGIQSGNDTKAASRPPVGKIEALRKRMYEYALRNRQNPNVCLFPLGKEWNDLRCELHANLDLIPVIGRSKHGEYEFCGMLLVPCTVLEIRMGRLENENG